MTRNPRSCCATDLTIFEDAQLAIRIWGATHEKNAHKDDAKPFEDLCKTIRERRDQRNWSSLAA